MASSVSCSMVHAVVLISVLLAHSGHTAPAEQDCSAALDCYTRLRGRVVVEVNELPGPGPEGGDSLAEYRRFCGVQFPPASPCAIQDGFRNCTSLPDIQKRERVYEQLRGFVCAGDEKDWRRFLAILHTQVSDPCKGAISATQDVLRSDTGKCGSVRKLFNECASQQRLPTEVLEPGMELLGCTDLQPTLSTSPSPGPQPYTQPDCKLEDVRHCLKEQERLLASGLGLTEGSLIGEEESCYDQQTCVDQQLLEGCSHNDTLELPVQQAAVDAVRRAACENGRAILKGIRSAASCFDPIGFRACLIKSDIKLGNAPSKEQCDSAFMKTDKCISESAKPCFQADQAKNANKLIAAYLGTFGCASTQKPDQEKGKGNGSGLASTSALALSFGLVAAFALRH